MLEYLDWDSQFLGFKVGRFVFQDTPQHWAALETLALQKQYALIYCFVPSQNNLRERFEHKVPKALWVDGKTTFVKQLDKNHNLSTNPNVHSVLNFDKEMEDLAIQTGVYSRFKTDPKFEQHVYEDLYRLWIKNALNRSMALEVLAYEEQGKKMGFVTIGKKDTRADIGLIGVDALARGKGIAQSLIQQAELFSMAQNFDTLQVVTQQENIPACKLYEKSGFQIESCVHIFHLWNKENLIK